MIERIIKHIAAFRNRPSQRLLDTIYGPQAKPLRTQVAALMSQSKAVSFQRGKAAQYGNLRQALLAAIGATGNCKAAEDADFERRAKAILDAAEDMLPPDSHKAGKEEITPTAAQNLLEWKTEAPNA